MRVALDARNLQVRPPDGIGRVLANVIPRLGAEVELTLLYDPRRGPVPEDGLGLRSRVPSGTAWLQGPVASWLASFDGIFHCPFYALPYRQAVPMVVSLWDLTFETHPQWLPPHKRLAFRAQARHAARTARRVVVGSAVVHAEVRDRYGVPDERIVDVPLAADPVFHPRATGEIEPVLARVGVRQPYIVAFGGASRRRLELAGAAWLQAGGRELCDLLVVGGGRPIDGAVQSGPLDDEALAGALAGAVALLYPTQYEGFGLPAVEAQASGTPVICAPVGALPEALGADAAWVRDAGCEAWSAALRRVVTDNGYRDALSRRGLSWRQAQPCWDAVADGFRRAYREAAGSLGSRP